MESKEQFEKYKGFGMLIALLLLIGDVYYYYYQDFAEMGLRGNLFDRIFLNVVKTKIFNSPFYPKFGIILMTIFFVMLDKGKKSIEMDKNKAIQNAIMATIFFLATALLINILPYMFLYIIAIAITYSFLISSYSTIHRILDKSGMNDRYNMENKIFPQTTQMLENDLSINIPYKFISEYTKKGVGKDMELTPIYTEGFINIVAPDRASIILGKPGSGKSYSFNEEFIRQAILKGFSMINYDYKFPTLTNIAYNYYLNYKDSYSKYPGKERFAIINLDDPRYSDRCNPLHKDLLETQSQAIDAVYTIFYNIDKKSATKQDFFQMSAMSITCAALWFLRNFEEGRFCSFPHLIELIQQSDEKLLPILDSYPELRYFTSAFTDALKKESFEQLSGQTASARIPLGKCATPEMFWVMTDPDNTGINLRVNRKEEVTILNVANNPETQKTNAPGLGLYMSQAAKLINKPDRAPCLFHVDELPTIFLNGLDNLIATARSNKVIVVLSAQDYTQLVADYGKETADKIFNTIGNIFAGQVAIDTARKISDAIGKFNYQTQSISINNDSTSVSYNTQRDYIVPPEDISQMSQGEFTGIVADTIKQPLKTKAFRGVVSPSKEDLGDEQVEMRYPDITKASLLENQTKIQNEINYVIESEINRMNELRESQQQHELEVESNKIREEIFDQKLPFVSADAAFDYDDDESLSDIEYKSSPTDSKEIIQPEKLFSDLIKNYPIDLDNYSPGKNAQDI